MPESGYNTIQLYYRNTTGGDPSLAQGELAINTFDESLWYADHDGDEYEVPLINLIGTTGVVQTQLNTITANDWVTSARIANDAVSGEHLDKTVISDHTDATVATGDYILYGDASDSANLKKDTVQGLLDLIPGGTTAGDDVTVGDAAILLTTTAGNITLDAQGNNTDIIFRGTDASSDTTFLTIDGSDGGTLVCNNKVQAGSNGFVVGNTTITTSQYDVSSGNFELDVEGDITLDANGADLHIKDDGTTSFSFIQATNSEIDIPRGNLLMDVEGDLTISCEGDQIIFQDGNPSTRFTFNLDGTPELDVAGAFTIDCDTELSLDVPDGADVFMKYAGTTSYQFACQAAPKLDVTGNFRIDASGTLDLDSSSGDITLDADGDIILDAGGGDVFFGSALGTACLKITNSSSDVLFKAVQNGKDMKFITYDDVTVLDINDGGYLGVGNGATGPGEIRFFEDSSNGSNYVSLIGPASTGTVTLTLPSTAGTIARTADITGSNSGTNTGDQTTVSGNAGTVTNGVYTTNNISALAASSSANFISVCSDETGSGSLVFATSPTLVTPALGTPASGTLSNCTAATQSSSDNSTKLATTAYADAAGGGGGGGSGTMTTVKAAGSQVGGADIVTLDFGTGIDATESPNTEINVSVDVSDFMASGVNNYVLTATGTDAFKGEANLTYDGADLANAGGVITASGGFVSGGNTGISSQPILFTDATNTLYSWVNVGGLVTSLAALSDERLKENITPFNTGLSLINQVEMKSYKFKDDYASANNIPDDLNSFIGIIAQDIEAIDSEYIKEDDDGMKSPSAKFGLEHRAAMHNALKELSAKNDALEARIATLEAA